jgi:hypothetical protein
VGRQSVLWDVAGAIVEWRLDVIGTSALLGALAKHLPVSADQLKFYSLSYAAFRMGAMSLCADITSDDAERARMTAAAKLYRDSLLLGLSSERE